MSDPAPRKRKKAAATISGDPPPKRKSDAALTEDAANACLAAYLEANPWSKVGRTKPPNETLAVLAPWAEDAIAIEIPSDPLDAEKLCEALNSLIMPERYTAIWHRDTSILEVIYTAYTVGEDYTDLENRKFTFTYEGVTHACFFGVSSERLILVAEYTMPLTSSMTQWRNLFSYHYFALARKGKTTSVRTAPTKAISFWITGLNWGDQDSILGVVNHLNFYMRYYDLSSPRIIVHSPRKEAVRFPQTSRFPFGSFPNTIAAISLDDNLFHFWDASISGDPIRRFLYNYMIVEYASYYFLDDTVRRKLRLHLLAPNAASNVDELVQGVVEIVAEDKVHDAVKIENMMKRCVDPLVAWREVQNRMDVFAEETAFDGGFVAKHLISKNCAEADFVRDWPGRLPHVLRDMRNALSHGREQRMASVITPTTANFERLQMWIPLLSAIAREVMVYRNIV